MINHVTAPALTVRLFSPCINFQSPPGLSPALQEVIQVLFKGFLSMVGIIKVELIILGGMDVCSAKGVLFITSP